MNSPAEKLNLCQGSKLVDAALHIQKRLEKKIEISSKLIEAILVERKDLFFVN